MSDFHERRHFALPLRALSIAILLQFGWFSAVHAGAQNAVGTVDALKGTAKVIRAGADDFQLIAENSPIYRKDIIKTDANSKIRLKFVDDSFVSLGADSTLKITKYVFSTERKKRSSFFTIPEGIFRVIVTKFMPDSRVEVQTATAVSAVRGTDWMGLASPSSTAIFVSDGIVSVRSGNRRINGEVLLEQGEGTVVMLDESLTPKKKWGQAKVSDFVNRTAID